MGNPYKECYFHVWFLLLLEVNQVLVIQIDTHISEGAPCFLNFLGRNNFLGLLSLFAPFLETGTPGPLNLDSADVIHGESVILEQPSCEGHLVCSLDECGTEVLHAPVFVLGHYVEWRR